MNYFALNPSHSLPAQLPSQTCPSNSPLPTPLIIKAISIALANSIKNYHLATQSHHNDAQPSQITENIVEEPANQLDPSKRAQDGQFSVQMTVDRHVKNVRKQNCVPLRKRHPTRSKAQHHLSTSEEPAEERPEKALLLREERTRKKQTAEGKIDQPATLCPLPKVDLVDCAYLPAFGLERAQLAKMRNQLNGRRVDEWNEKIKLRGDKRELRLLTS